MGSEWIAGGEGCHGLGAMAVLWMVGLIEVFGRDVDEG
jgi:hypothetical protein